MAFVHSNGADIHFEVRGTGSPVALVAGTGYSGETWHPRLCDALAARHTLITFDHRGTGLSSATDDDYTTAMFGADAVAVLREVGLGPVHLIGHSMGGRVSQEIYFTEPATVRSITLAASGAGAGSVIPLSRVGIPLGAVRGMVTAGYEQYICDKHRSNFFTTEFAAEHPEEVEWLDDAYLKSKPDLDNYLKHVRARQAHNEVDRFGSISVPVMIVVGTADTDVGGFMSHLDQSLALRELLPSARFELIDGAKHGFMWENLEVTLGLFNSFLGEVEAPTLA